jgi:hypothetical protein
MYQQSSITLSLYLMSLHVSAVLTGHQQAYTSHKRYCVCQCFLRAHNYSFQLYTHIIVKRYKIQMSNLKIKKLKLKKTF